MMFFLSLASGTVWGLGSLIEPELTSCLPFWAHVCVSTPGFLGQFHILSISFGQNTQGDRLTSGNPEVASYKANSGGIELPQSFSLDGMWWLLHPWHGVLPMLRDLGGSRSYVAVHQGWRAATATWGCSTAAFEGDRCAIDGARLDDLVLHISVLNSNTNSKD